MNIEDYSPWNIKNNQNKALDKQIKDLQAAIAQMSGYTSQPVNNDPFTTARAGLQAGGLQDHINRLTQQGGNTLNAGLLGYQPANVQAGNAGGTPQNYQAPQDYQGLLQMMQGLGKRPWMGG